MTRTMQAMMIIGFFQLIFRGTDLIFSPASETPSVDGVEGMVWGITCLIAAAVVLFGTVKRSPRIAIYGSLISFAAYAMFAWFSLEMTLFASPPANWRIAGDHAASSVFWLVIAVSINFRHGIHTILLRKEADRGVGAAAH